ncbi:MAG: SIS domain-containing protein [Candidatus Eisenbacteria bacterium]|nr:SIS domain-containing protein [Candidatus Eisenbacteria bacterium]
MFESKMRERLGVLDRVREELAAPFEAAASRVAESLRNGGKIYLFGNGGSAADAQHLATELIDRLTMKRDAIPALALTTNASLITAVANDHGFELVFARQVEAYARPGDVLAGITTSGRSGNVLRAFRTGRRIGTVNVAFTGARGLAEDGLADHLLAVPSEDTQLIQEMHIALGHLLCQAIEERLFRS